MHAIVGPSSHVGKPFNSSSLLPLDYKLTQRKHLCFSFVPSLKLAFHCGLGSAQRMANKFITCGLSQNSSQFAWRESLTVWVANRGYSAWFIPILFWGKRQHQERNLKEKRGRCPQGRVQAQFITYIRAGELLRCQTSLLMNRATYRLGHCPSN